MAFLEFATQAGVNTRPGEEHEHDCDKEEVVHKFSATDHFVFTS